MAVSETFGGKNLRIKYDAGFDDNQKTIITSKTYSKLRADATNEEVFAVSQILVGLQQHDMFETTVVDTTILN